MVERLALGLIFFLLALAAARALAEGKPQLEGVVNLNTAPPEALQLLPGIGPAKVRNVIAYRRAHPFRTVDELVRIKGIGRKMVRRLRLHLAVSGPTTAQHVIRPPADIAADAPAVPPPPKPAARPLVFKPAILTARRPPVFRPPFPRGAANHCAGPP